MLLYLQYVREFGKMMYDAMANVFHVCKNVAVRSCRHRHRRRYHHHNSCLRLLQRSTIDINKYICMYTLLHNSSIELPSQVIRWAIPFSFTHSPSFAHLSAWEFGFFLFFLLFTLRFLAFIPFRIWCDVASVSFVYVPIYACCNCKHIHIKR